MPNQNITVYLRKGAQVMDLNGSEYALDDFTPPGENQAFNVAAGSSANITGGGKAVGRTWDDREVRVRVQLLGSSSQQIEAQARQLGKLAAAWDDPAEPLYFEYKGDTLPAPLWGQFGALRRYQVVHAQVDGPGSYYQVGNTRGKFLVMSLALRVKPLALGNRQRVATASGGVAEDVLGMADGSARGTAVDVATTNKATNPVFGAGTYSTGWTAAANIVATQNTDLAYVYPGAVNSALLLAKAGTNNTFTQSLNAGNTNAHTLTAYVMRPDRAAVTSADVALYYGGAATTSYTSIGNGVYRLTAAVTGVNAATATGVAVASGRQVYLLGMQLEELAYPTRLCFGDLLGCAWTGTAHASTSSRTAGVVKLPYGAETATIGAGTVSVSWTPDASSAVSPSRAFFAIGDLTGYFETSNDQFYLIDGTNTVTTAAQTWSAGETIHLDFTWGPAGLAIYKNGTSVGSGSYTIPAAPTSIYLGCSAVGGLQAGGALSITTYASQLTAAQAAARYAATATLSGRRVDWLAWLWTKDGDDVVDNYSDGSHDNFAVAAGVAGTADAQTEFKVTPDPALDYQLWLGRHVDSAAEWRKTLSRWWAEGSGTSETGNSNNDYQALGVTAPRAGLGLIPERNYDLRGDFHFFSRLRSHTGAISTEIGYYITTNNGNTYSSVRTVNSTATYKLFYAGKLNIQSTDAIKASERKLTLSMNFGFASGTNRLDFFQVWNGPVFRINPVLADIPGGGGAIATPATVRMRGHETYFDTSTYNPDVTGDAIELAAGQYNTLQVILASDNDTYTLTRTLTFSEVYVTPRWGVL